MLSLHSLQTLVGFVVTLRSAENPNIVLKNQSIQGMPEEVSWSQEVTEMSRCFQVVLSHLHLGILRWGRVRRGP